jgi:hypothetical protein
MIMTKSRKLFTVALAAVAVAGLSLGATGTAFAGKKHHHHHHGHHHHKFFRSVIVVSTADDDDCEWKWYRTRSGYLVKKWVCD